MKIIGQLLLGCLIAAIVSGCGGASSADRGTEVQPEEQLNELENEETRTTTISDSEDDCDDRDYGERMSHPKNDVGTFIATDVDDVDWVITINLDGSGIILNESTQEEFYCSWTDNRGTIRLYYSDPKPSISYPSTSGRWGLPTIKGDWLYMVEGFAKENNPNYRVKIRKVK